ncbi:MAG: recombinase family protein [Comamonadaceae bacterium]|nr:recombinase family protein [Comamonadaceae bacterium]
MAIVGYARVSTTDQSLEIQAEQLAAAGIDKLFQEKVSGVKPRPSATGRPARVCARGGHGRGHQARPHRPQHQGSARHRRNPAEERGAPSAS